jgi:hypothetical protein
VSLQRELQNRGIASRMKIAMGELEVLVNGQRVFSHKETGLKPDTASLVSAVMAAGKPGS